MTAPPGGTKGCARTLTNGRCLRRYRRWTANFEFNDDEVQLRPVKEQQVDVEGVAVDSEMVVPANDGEPVAELEQEGLQPRDQSGR